MDKKYDFVVFGSGITGMTMSILLASGGARVLLVEKSPVIGGSMQRFHRRGIPFDTGFHFTTRLDGCMGDMLRVLNFQPPLACHSIPTKIYLADQNRLFEFPHGGENIRTMLEELYPENREGIRKYFADQKRIFFDTRLFNLEGDSFSAMAFQKEDSILLKEYLDSLGLPESLRCILAGFVTCHGTPCGEISLANHCRVSFGLMDDLVRVDGSGGAFVAAFRKRAEELGIEIRTECTLAECLDLERLHCHRMRLTDGTTLEFRSCVMTMHPLEILHLLPERFRKGIFADRVREFEDGAGFFTVFGVLEEKSDAFREELTSHFSTSKVDWIMAPDHPEATATGIMLTREVGLDGKQYDTVTAFQNVFREETAQWENSTSGRRPPSYYDYKRRKSEDLAEKIYRIYPDFKGKLRQLDSASMLTYRDYLSPFGSAYGIRQKIGQNNIFGKLPIRNFYAAGQNALLPGAMGAMLSAFLLWRKIVGEEAYGRMIRKAREAQDNG